jgi:hypothetical protein
MTSGAADAVAPFHAIVTKRKKARCGHCRKRMVRLTGELHHADGIAGIFYASLYNHDGVRDVYVDAILGTWTTDDNSDHVTVTTRTGPVEPEGHIASTLVDGGASYPEEAIFGHKISRDEGLRSPRLSEFWAASDAVLSQVEEIDQHLYGH